MFTGFLYHLRAFDLKVSPTEWLALIRAVATGHSRCSLSVFYHLARSVLVKNEAQYDRYDMAFATYFHGIEGAFQIDEVVLQWLENPELPRELTDAERALLQAMDLDSLREELLRRLAEQAERHDRGNRWIGTGGTSPFGHGGTHPTGVRIGGQGGARSAVSLAEERRFRNLRHDRILDTRQIGSALRRLRRLAKDERYEELDVPATIDRSAREGGDIELVFSPPRANRIKLLLLVDVGGSMDPHADLTERLFSAAHAASHFRQFRHYFFHNCVYGRLYTDLYRYVGPPTDEVLREIDETWSLILVGDAWMAPHELSFPRMSVFDGQESTDGLTWLRRLRDRVPKSVWLNPEPEQIWSAPTVRLIRTVFPMFPLTLDGLTDAVDVLRGARHNTPAR